MEGILHAPPTDCDKFVLIKSAQICSAIAKEQFLCKLFSLSFYLLYHSQFCLEICNSNISHAAKQG